MIQSVSIREPAVAGSFYPRQQAALRAEVNKLLENASVSVETRAPKALIVPHAGFVYSGPIAANAYAQFLSSPLAKAANIERIVLLGPAHRVYVPGVAAAGAARFETPLGGLDVDLQWLARVSDLKISARAHAPEHSLEVQLPFLQSVLPHARIVPLLVSDAPSSEVGDVLERLWGGDETRIVISSDLSHYLPYQTARAVDEQTVRRILALSDQLNSEQACGCAAINGLLHVAKRKRLRPRLLDCRNSGDTAGGRDQVVGYAAFAFYEDHDAGT